jgi:hypothetical protein
VLISLLIGNNINAQNLGIGPDTFDPDASAGVEMRFTNKGLLIPRVALTSSTDQTTIPSPANSLLVYNLGTGGLTPAGYYYWDGSQWVKFATGTGAGITSIGPGSSGAETSGSGLTFSANPITTAGTIALSNSGVTAGTYGNTGGNVPSITVDARGRLTSAANRALSYSDVGAAAASHTHTQLHNQLHAMTSTSDHSAGTWKIFYSNGSGYVQELSLGSSGTYLRSNGTTSAPTWASPSVSETDPYAWKITGNSNITDGTHFLGTTNNVPLTFKINNVIAGKLSTPNTTYGYRAGYSMTTTTGGGNTLIGKDAGYKLNNSAASENTFVGISAGNLMTTGKENVAIGASALYCYNTSGYGGPGGNGNVAIGKWAMFNPVSGNYNVAVGYDAYSLPHTGSYNVFIGYSADGEISYNPNNSIGIGAYSKVRADNAVAIGYKAYAIQPNTIVLGGISGVNGATVTSKVGIGTNTPQATLHVVSPNLGTNEVTMRLGPVGGGTSATPSRKSILDFWSTFDNHTDQGPRRTASIVVGFSGGAWGKQYMSFFVGDGPSANDDGHLPTSERIRLLTGNTNNLVNTGWTTMSDKRLKTNITSLHYGINDIMKLQPIEYEFHDAGGFDYVPEKISKESVHSIGFIAQDVYEIIPEVVYKPDDTEKELWGMQYEKLTPVLVKAIQEQQQMINDLQQKLEQQQKTIETLLLQNQEIIKKLNEN